MTRFLAAALALALLVATLSAAGTAPTPPESHRYVASGVATASPRLSILGTEAPSVARVAFTPGDARPIAVDVRDATGGLVPLVVCQDLNGDSFCTYDEPYLDACASGVVLPNEFERGGTLLVQVLPRAAWCPGGLGTTGTVTVTYGPAP
ncbi:MAG TPA: hypothetical protein VNZ52_11685 [Candidatus Thermoplasmatota archaeon]|nr:hypothetical protein [Candidatus Thermoplasmatota archaeon]